MATKSFQSATPNAAKTLSDVWVTPQWIIDNIGISDLDPCAYLPDGIEPYVKTASNYFTEEQDGLKQDWSRYKNAFVNFPYSQSKLWMEKCLHEYRKGCQIIVLCFARTETLAWQNNVIHATGLNLIKRRIRFLDSSGKERSNGNAPSCLIAFGDQSLERIKNIDGIFCKIINSP